MNDNIHRFLTFVLASIFLTAAVSALANEQEAREPLSQQELAALEQFLRLSDEELDRIQEAIGRVRAMPLEERRAHAEEIVRFRSLPAEERTRIRDGWGWRSARDRDDWRAMMQGLSPEERQEIHEKMRNVDPGERTALRLEILERWRD